MVKSPPRPRKQTDAAVDGILARLVERRQKAGDSLPSEDEMGRLFGLSRVSLREGLQGLKFLGLLESAPRRGTRVRAVDYALLGRVLGFQVAVAEPARRQLMDARLFVELGALDLVFERAGAREIALLRAAADCRRRDDSPAAVERHRRADCRFHQLLLEIGGNEVLSAFARMLEMFFAGSPGTVALSRVVSREHAGIVEAVEEGNRELARGLLRAHLTRRPYPKRPEARSAPP